MATRTELENALRDDWLTRISTALKAQDETVLRVGSNRLACPTVDGDHNDKWIEIIVKVPLGSRDGDAYDGYSLRDSYDMHCADTEAKRVKKEAERKAKAEAKAKAKEKGD